MEMIALHVNWSWTLATLWMLLAAQGTRYLSSKAVKPLTLLTLPDPFPKLNQKTKNVAVFLEELSKKLPALLLVNLSVILPHLNGEGKFDQAFSPSIYIYILPYSH